MKKFTIVCFVAMAAFVLTSCGNRNAKKAATEVEPAQVEVVETEAPAQTAECACEAECTCEECACTEETNCCATENVETEAPAEVAE